MAATNSEQIANAQAIAGGDIKEGVGFSARAGAHEFAVAGPSGPVDGLNPYDLLSASLATCSAMTIRMHALHKNYPLTHVDVAVTYHKATPGNDGFFERTILLQGSLSDDQRQHLIRGAEGCPVGRVLGMRAEIRTGSSDPLSATGGRPRTDYDEDLRYYSIVNIDPD